MPLEDREQDDGAADVGEDEHQVEECPEGHAAVGAGAGDEGGIAQDGPVGEHGAYRGDEGEDEQHAHGERGLSR